MKDHNIWTLWCELVSIKKQLPFNPARLQVQTRLMISECYYDYLICKYHIYKLRLIFTRNVSNSLHNIFTIFVQKISTGNPGCLLKKT